MGKKDKIRKQRKANQCSNKNLHKLEKKLKKIEQDAGEPTIEDLLEKYRQEQKSVNDIVVTISDPPSPRSHFTLTACEDTKELVLFGGEYFDGKKVHMYPELYVYQIKNHCWLKVVSPNTPPPRSSHQAVYVKGPNTPSSVWVFGGEFASPSETRFHHYGDLWCLRTRTRKWEPVSYSNAGPCARSGHRMLCQKMQIFIFGGFCDSGSKTVYYNDFWQFDISTSYWTRLELEGQVPTPRSACLFFPGVEQKYFYVVGGYSKSNVTRDMERGVVHQDCYQLTLEKNSSIVKCVSIRPCGTRPMPPRSAMAGFTVGGDRALIFGGVHDVESEDGEVINGYFHNDLFTMELSKGRWHPFSYALPKKSNSIVTTSYSEDQGSTSSLNSKISQVTIGHEKSTLQTPSDPASTSAEPIFIAPSPRASTVLTVLGSGLYLYGGVFEAGDRKFTLNDFYFLDLHRPVSWECLFKGTHETQGWFESDSEDDEDDEMTTDDESEEESEHKTRTNKKAQVSGSGNNKTPQCSAMSVDKDNSDSESDDADEELVEDAPIPNSNETYTTYWSRTTTFWCDLVTKGVQDSTDESTDRNLVLKLAQRLAQDFYQDNVEH